MPDVLKRVLVPARITELVPSQVAELIGPMRMAQITAVDSEPMFVSMIVGHEGVSGGRITNVGQIVKEWSAKVIRRLAELFRPAGRQPAAIYDGIEHYHGNEDARVSVGEVVHGRTTQGEHGLQADAIGYVYPGAIRAEIREMRRDICSIEADVTYSILSNGRAVVEDVFSACAVVLGHSSKQLPGFAGARVALITEMVPPDDPPKQDPPKDPPKADPPKQDPPRPPEPTRDELIEMAKKAGITAQDLGAAPSPEPNPVPAPPENKGKTAVADASSLDLRSPKFNEFLPAAES